MKYFTRLRVKRVFEWGGKTRSFNRKLKTCEFDSLTISVKGLKSIVIKAGQHVLIEGEDDNNPFVARVVRLVGDESGSQKKVMVQWFMRVSEVPPSKLKLLGREPHPQEIFYYQGSCEDDVDAESIIRTVTVKHVEAASPFPDCKDEDTLFVKLSWDKKSFKAVDAAVVEGSVAPSLVKRSLSPSPPCSLPAATPVSRHHARHALPAPDLAVMHRASSASYGAVNGGSGQCGAAVEAESLHSTSKISASKCLSSKRRNAASRAPSVRKKLELNSPDKNTSPEDILDKLLDEELEPELMMAQRMSSSPPQTLTSCQSLSPISSARRTRDHQDRIQLGDPSVILHRLSQPGTESPPLTRDESSRVQLDHSPQQSPLQEPGSHACSVQTPRTQNAALKKHYATRGQTSKVDDEDTPTLPAAASATMPRSSKRKSVQAASSRIRKQLKLMDTRQDQELDSDGEDEFVPSLKELQSSSDEDDVLEGDKELMKQQRCRSDTTEPRTPRSTGKVRFSTRTPCRTPRRMVRPGLSGTTEQHILHATPNIPNRSLPVRQPTNVLEEARARLHVSSVPESLPCREQEFQDIYSFVESKIIDGTGGCMYISGVPGTGKTATVHEVMRCLQHAADADEIPPFSFIEINGMKMTDPHQAYVQILQKLTGQKATADHAAALLDKRFSNAAPRKETTVLLVDELDLLWTRKQNVMYSLFDWPTRRHARLVVLTIANTMDLPERIMINRVASRLGLTRMSFQPYSFKQLQQIITSRLNKVKAFEGDALQLVSRKVAALSGDARRCLDICRRATEICEHAGSGLVSVSHVMEALNEMFSSAYIVAIKCASVQEQLFLRAVIAEFRRLGLEEATFQQVFVQHQALCRVEGLQPVSVSEGLTLCQRLGSCRLLLLEPSRLGVLQRVRLNVSQDDVLYALKAD
ncbi:origin recognition complex subunit 1 [Thalassophryne amazonica]|uniref:origin recognition complex subunit 1 n=1 Tax=Thalassophryne amazonica TaxID=390379 RepID=UPI0014711DAD|nr:origin recognition complex subunit 1 [Thalassophryne amazonica]